MSTDQAEINNENYMPRPKKKGRGLLLSGIVVLLLAGGLAYYWYLDEEEVVESQPLIVAVDFGDIENTIAATGSLIPFETVEVGAQVSGQLLRLYIEAGDLVEQGQLLAEIDARQQQQRVESSRASLAGQEALLEARQASLLLAEANAERQRRLMAEDATSQLDFDNAVNALASAQANLIQTQRQIDQSLANLAIEEQQLQFTRIVAPIAGTIVSVAMTEGRTLNATQQAPTILTIADLTKMSVEAEISEADVANLNNGMEVYFTTLGSGNRRWQSSLRQILPQPTITNNVVLYTGLFDVDNTDGTLLPEMTAQIYFVTSAARNVLTVPIGALSFVEGGPATAAGGFNELMGAAAAGNRPLGASSPQGLPPGGFGGRRGQPGANGTARPEGLQLETRPRRAMVQVQSNDGSMEQREVLVGITSRVSAEVLSGLDRGDQVVAGLIQGNAGGFDRDQFREALGLPAPGGGGGFRGPR